MKICFISAIGFTVGGTFNATHWRVRWMRCQIDNDPCVIKFNNVIKSGRSIKLAKSIHLWMQPHLDLVLCNNSSKPYFIEIPGTSKPQYCHRSFHSLRTAEPQRPRSKPATIINVGFYTRFAVRFIIFYYYCILLIHLCILKKTEAPIQTIFNSA